jgi:hypothetical protein
MADEGGGPGDNLFTSSILHRIPEPASREIATDIPQCCCGRPDCAFRAHSERLIHQVERDARTAGELGQVCLSRLICL